MPCSLRGAAPAGLYDVSGRSAGAAPIKEMKNLMKKIIPFLASLCLLAGTALPVWAIGSAGDDAPGSEPTPRVIFENAQNETPDLFVTKEIESLSEGYEVPEDLSFTFILRLDGELVNRMEYRLYDASGTEVFDKDTNGNNVPWKTDRSGTFSLKPGQTAKFEYVGTGVAYEVTEVPSEGWVQTRPAGGAAAVGTVGAQGAWAAFTNTTGGGGETTRMVVQKTISFPEGYEAPETPDFPFLLEIDGKPYSRESYTIRDLESGLEIGTGTTDGEGRFTLKGGQAAEFSEVPQDVDYRIAEEVDAEGLEEWRCTGEAVREGTTGTGGAVLENFNNASASFAVSKRMEDGSIPEDAFTFLLTHEDRSVWEGADYLLYTTGGEPVTDGQGIQVTGATDENGNFTLQAGQTALFTGIPAGTVYNVSETADPDYIQTLPLNVEGYTDKTVTDAVEVLPFVNKEAPASLSVTKVIKNLDGEAPLEQKEFTFVLRYQENKGYQPVAGAVYSIESGTSQNTYRTDGEGRFTLKANETARFTGLAPGYYQVEELDPGYEYKAVEAVQEKSLAETGDNISFLFTNQYAAKLFDLYLEKEDRGNGSALSGAEFMLYRDELGQNPVQTDTYITGADGKITVQNLKTGTYYLVETKAPQGYQLLANPVKIDVTWEGSIMKVTVDGKSVTSQEEDDQIHIVQHRTENDEVHVKIYNSRNFTLPLTGGNMIVYGGILLALAALIFILWRMGKRQKE